MPDSFAAPWTVARQALHGIFQGRILKWDTISSLGDLLDRGTEPIALASLALAGRLFPTKHPGSPADMHYAEASINLLAAHCTQSLAMPGHQYLSYPTQGPGEGDCIIPRVT